MKLVLIQDKRTHRGQGLVEFALVLLLLLLIIFGVLDLGRVFFATITITNAAREGARYGIKYPAAVLPIQQVAVAEANNNGISINTANVAVTCRDPNPAITTFTMPPCASGRPLRVTVTYSFHLTMGWILSSPIQVSRYAEMLVP